MMIWNLETIIILTSHGTLFKSRRGMYGFECRESLVCGSLLIVYTAHAHVQAKIFKLIFHKR